MTNFSKNKLPSPKLTVKNQSCKKFPGNNPLIPWIYRYAKSIWIFVYPSCSIWDFCEYIIPRATFFCTTFSKSKNTNICLLTWLCCCFSLVPEFVSYSSFKLDVLILSRLWHSYFVHGRSLSAVPAKTIKAPPGRMLVRLFLKNCKENKSRLTIQLLKNRG